MSVGWFTNKKYQPSDAEVRLALGASVVLWQELVDYLRAMYPTQEDFKFMYGKNYGWACRFRLKGQLLTSLYPGKESFAVQVNLSPQAVEKALEMDLGLHARQAIESATPYPEGRWCFIPVTMEQGLEDVRRLLALRVETKRLA